LLSIVERDLLDAQGPISADRRFGITYNAALKLCTILMYASGFRPECNAAQDDSHVTGSQATAEPQANAGGDDDQDESAPRLPITKSNCTVRSTTRHCL
jgi:hypothetical protein